MYCLCYAAEGRSRSATPADTQVYAEGRGRSATPTDTQVYAEGALPPPANSRHRVPPD